MLTVIHLSKRSMPVWLAAKPERQAVGSVEMLPRCCLKEGRTLMLGLSQDYMGVLPKKGYMTQISSSWLSKPIGRVSVSVL